MEIRGCKIEKSGIPKIEIPVRLKDLDEEVIAYYLPYCIAQAKENAKKIRYLNDYVDGSFQPIDKHIYDKKTSGNAENRIKENHAYEIIQFKEGFYCGDSIQFSSKNPDKQEAMFCLNQQLVDTSYHSKSIERWHNALATGTAISFIMPRADIFNDIGEGENRVTTYKTESEGYNVKTDACFVYEIVDGENNAIVYSSYIGESGLKDLFCFNIAQVRNRITNRNEQIVTVYTREAIYEYKKVNEKNELVYVASNVAYGRLPMTEHATNNTRISPIEVINDLLNAINLTVSIEVNSIQDKVYQLLVFLGADIGDEGVDALYQNGVVCVPPSQFGNTDVKAISNDLKCADTNTSIERMLTRAFDIVGVPLASAAVSSGNNEAAYLGGGWTNASVVAKRDIAYDERFAKEELEKIIKICSLNPQNPVNAITASEINIKYNINQSNNLLVKTQAMQNLKEIGFAIEDIVKTIPLFNDEANVAKRCEENLKKIQEQLKQLQNSTTNNSNEQPTGDNLKGEQKQQQAQQTQGEQAKSVS